MPVGFQPPGRVEIGYAKAIENALYQTMPEMTPEMSVDEWITHIAQLSLNRDLAEIGAAIAGNMVRWVNVINARTWREASARSQRSQRLYRLLTRELEGPIGIRIDQLTAENARLISSLPQDVAGYLTSEVARAQQQGARPETISSMIGWRFPQLVRSRTNLLARTETSKAATALTRARCEELRLPAYEWLTSHDFRVRPSHKLMNGVIVFWDDPP
jgi:SPP1 gp7 family putative phage head morphogenesis protein